jgi:uncharacterized protein YndB with AHSA1/START domain
MHSLEAFRLKVVLLVVVSCAWTVPLQVNACRIFNTRLVEEHIVRKQVEIRATPAEVWEALTNPEMTKEYFFRCRVYSDWKPGSEIAFKRKFLWWKLELKGEILHISPEKYLQYTLLNSRSGNEVDPASRSLVTEELSYQDGITTLQVTDDVGSSHGADKRYEKSEKAWDKVLKRLKKYVEAK